jgi:hypothetical protein
MESIHGSGADPLWQLANVRDGISLPAQESFGFFWRLQVRRRQPLAEVGGSLRLTRLLQLRCRAADELLCGRTRLGGPLQSLIKRNDLLAAVSFWSS